MSVIAADFKSLQGLSEEMAARYVFEELRRFIPVLEEGDIERVYAQLNIATPLLLNTVGAWPYRPGTRTRIENLYIAGDYCQTEADLTTMESAVISGRQTAAAVLNDVGMAADNALPIPLAKPPGALFKIMKWLFLPGAIGMRICIRVFTGKK